MTQFGSLNPKILSQYSSKTKKKKRFSKYFAMTTLDILEVIVSKDYDN